MALKEKITQKELILHEILKHPVLCGEFIENLDKLPHEERFEYHKYQEEMLCDFNPYVEFTCGRSVGKTKSLSGLLIWALINNIFPNEYINYHVPGKNHVEPVFTSLVRMFRTNSLLKHFLPNKAGINSSELIIKLDNGSSLLCRIAGQTGTGVAVIGLHSPFIIFDEHGYYPWSTFIEAQPGLNTWVSGYRILSSGVPTGQREKNVCWHVDQENPSYTKHRVSALDNPRFNDDDLRKAKEIYGDEDSDDFIHLILGHHGRPVFSLFSRESMFLETYGIEKMSFDGVAMGDNIAEYINKLTMLSGFPSKEDIGIFGIDLGYTEPTAIFVMYMDKFGKIRFRNKISLTKVSFPIQQKIIDFLDTKYQPALIGIDKGTLGIPVVQLLMEDTQYLHKNYSDRMYPITFNANVAIGIDSNQEEIVIKAKPLAVSTLQEYVINGKIIFSSTDLETITELERMTYTKNLNGDIIYRTLTERGGKKGEDHFTAALLCAALAYHMKNDSFIINTKSKKLINPRWVIGKTQ
jgi:hypothetical protein